MKRLLDLEYKPLVVGFEPTNRGYSIRVYQTLAIPNLAIPTLYVRINYFKSLLQEFLS